MAECRERDLTPRSSITSPHTFFAFMPDCSTAFWSELLIFSFSAVLKSSE